MKKYVLKFITYTLIISCIVLVCDYASCMEKNCVFWAKLTNSEDYLPGTSGISAITPFIEKVQKSQNTTQLLLGDSISRQLFQDFSNINPDFCIASTNAAINITGQYMIAMEYLNCNPNAKDIWLIMHPQALARPYDTELGYSYSVMPFVASGLIKYLHEDTKRGMAYVYHSFALSPAFVTFVEKSAVNHKIYFNYLQKRNREYWGKSPLDMANTYICDLYYECSKRNVSLHLLPSPSTEYFRELNDKYEEEYLSSEIGTLFPNYYSNIYYYSNDYSDDLSHLGEKYKTPEYFSFFIRESYADTTLLNYFNLSY